MDEYTGQLIGGPDDGNFVTATVTEIMVKDTIELWLDGQNKNNSIVTTTGTYVWQEKQGYFIWKLKDSTVASRNNLDVVI